MWHIKTGNPRYPSCVDYSYRVRLRIGYHTWFIGNPEWHSNCKRFMINLFCKGIIVNNGAIHITDKKIIAINQLHIKIFSHKQVHPSDITGKCGEPGDYYIRIEPYFEFDLYEALTGREIL